MCMHTQLQTGKVREQWESEKKDILRRKVALCSGKKISIKILKFVGCVRDAPVLGVGIVMAMAACGDHAAANAASRMWHDACDMLRVPRGRCCDAWNVIADALSNVDIWHSLEHCVSFQADLWTSILESGADDVVQPAAFRMALVLRHAPSELVGKILHDVLNSHPECQAVTSYVLALRAEEEPSQKSPQASTCPAPPPGGPPTRDVFLYMDLELAVIGAPPAQYDEQARLVRKEFSNFEHLAYCELRLKVLNQFSSLPRKFLSLEFYGMDDIAMDNMNRELKSLREQR